MLENLVAVLRRVFTVIGTLIWVAVAAAATWFMRYVYEDAHEQGRFEREGTLVAVRVSDVSYDEQRSWRDMSPNSIYITFEHDKQKHKVQYTQDTMSIRTGDRVALLYHFELNRFRQPYVEPRTNADLTTSRLVKWTVADDLRDEHKMLAGLLIAASVLLFLGGGLINYLIHWPLLQTVGRTFLLVLLCSLGLFLVYDAVGRYRYWAELSTNGQPMQATVLSTDRHSHSKRSRNSFMNYTYSATVRFKKQERMIPIIEEEYRTLKPQDQIHVIYNSHLNDLMSAAYSLPFDVYLVPIAFWALFGLTAWFGRSKTKQQRVSTLATFQN